MSNPIELELIRDTFVSEENGREGFTLGELFLADGHVLICQTLEDQDRKLEEGNAKIYGKSAIPTGRYALRLYSSPKHGIVPLFQDVPEFKYVEIHKANEASELLGCVAVGVERTRTGVRNCAPALARILDIMQDADAIGAEVFCTIKRKEE